ncbi:MAG: DMT family transporter [Candidatus Hodarchaeota archaeon]
MKIIPRLKSQTYIFIGFSILLFGTVFIFSKQVIPPLNSVSYMFLRSALGSVFLFFVLGFKKNLKDCWQFIKNNIKSTILFALVLHLFPLILIFIATPITTATNQVIINNLNLTFVVIINLVFYGKKPSRRLGLVVIINFVGILLVLSPLNFTSNPTLLGDLITVFAIFLGAFYPGYNKRMAEKTDPLILGFCLNIFPAVALLPFTFMFNQVITYALLEPVGWFYMIWIGIGISSMGYVLVNAAYSDKNLTPEMFSLFLTLIPIVGLVFSLLIYKETIGWLNLLGALIIIFSIYWGNREKKKPQDEKDTFIRNNDSKVV